MPLASSSVNLTHLRKESVNLKIGQQRPPKLRKRKKSEVKQNREKKTEQNIQELTNVEFESQRRRDTFKNAYPPPHTHNITYLHIQTVENQR